MTSGPAFLFDLDGTLVDSVYQHLLAWQEALDLCGMPVSVRRIHRRIGMSGGLLANNLGIPWAIATSGERVGAARVLASLKVPDDVPIVTRDDVRYAKPDPDRSVSGRRPAPRRRHRRLPRGGRQHLGHARGPPGPRALGVGLLSGGYGTHELERAGAYRVYEDPADLLLHADEVGVRTT